MAAAAMGAAVVRRLHAAVAAAQPPRLRKLAMHPPKSVEVGFADGSTFHLSAEFLRVYSPAADSKIRSVAGEKVIFGRRHVGIMSAESVGNYGIRILFDDLHKTGIFTWDYLHHLGSNKFGLMRNYIRTLKKHSLSRDPQRRYQGSISCSSMIVKLILGLLWCLVHLVISLFGSWSHLRNNLECYLISLKLLPKYRNLHLERLAYLGVVVDSREAKNALKVKQLLHWFSTIGINYLILYDIEGVLKELIQPSTEASTDGNLRNSLDVVADTKASCCRHGGMFMECLSGSDGKEAIAKAANLLYSTCSNSDNKSGIIFTEADMTRALKSVGIGGPEPDLLLVYGPARCHLGFPAWRLRYTEIMYMGPLESMKYGTIAKALYQFSHKHQNYEDPILFEGDFWN
uniref:Gamma-butyrobetaine hydroxylase-like N-terminal domain-containing protein n=1 Tax=Leersia perrieri TaxID=77586 RepID=A0A0D9VDD2_9ORYZ